MIIKPAHVLRSKCYNSDKEFEFELLLNSSLYFINPKYTALSYTIPV